MKEYQTPTVTCDQETVGFFPAVIVGAAALLLGHAVGPPPPPIRSMNIHLSRKQPSLSIFDEGLCLTT